MLEGSLQYAGQVIAIRVDAAGDEGRLGPERQRDCVHRAVNRSVGARAGDLAQFAGGGVLTLGQAVDPVVEQQHREVDVAPQRVDQVVGTDRQRVAITSGDHDRQVRTGHGQARGDGQRPTMDGVHAEAVDVVGESRGAANAGDHHGVLAKDAQPRQQRLHRTENGVVTAARAPAHLLVAGEIFAVERGHSQWHSTQSVAGGARGFTRHVGPPQPVRAGVRSVR